MAVGGYQAELATSEGRDARASAERRMREEAAAGPPVGQSWPE
jgi:hypothetical protein